MTIETIDPYSEMRGMHHMGSGFRVDRDDDRALAGLEALR